MKSVLSLLTLSSLLAGSLAAPAVPGVDGITNGVGAELDNLPAGLGNTVDGLVDTVGETAPVKKSQLDSLPAGLGNTVDGLVDTVGATVPVKKSELDNLPAGLGNTVDGLVDTVGATVPVKKSELDSLPAGLGDTVDGLVGTVEETVPIKRAVKTTYVVSTFTDLLTTVKQHTSTINQTVDTFSVGDDKSVVGGLVLNELSAVVSAVSDAVDSMAGLEGVMTFSTSEVDTIGNAVFEIVIEITGTVFGVLKVVGIQDLLSEVVSELSIVVSKLVAIVGKVVVGVVDVLDNLIGVSGMVDKVDGLLTGLPLSLPGAEAVGI